MRTTETVTISLPAELGAEVARLAAAEGRTRSELFREAFRQYAQRRHRWEQLFAYGESRPAMAGLTEEEVALAVQYGRARSRNE